MGVEALCQFPQVGRTVEVIPAIDIRGGRCVRLYQGDFARETVFSDDPVAMAKHWADLGAPRLHVVDLDGAEQGEPANLAIIEGIAAAITIPIQVGGGIRRRATAKRLVDAGAQRVILGTAAVEDPILVIEACRRYGDAIIVGVDARDGLVATHGWKESTTLTAYVLMEQMGAIGVRRFIYTDISRDGTLTEPNFGMLEELIRKVRLPIIASGGISSLEHLKRLKELGVEGAIVGRALYTGALGLREAVQSL